MLSFEARFFEQTMTFPSYFATPLAIQALCSRLATVGILSLTLYENVPSETLDLARAARVVAEVHSDGRSA